MRQRSKSPILSKSTSKKKYFEPEGEKRLSPSPSQAAKMYKINQIPSYMKIDRPKLTAPKQEFLKKKIEMDISARIKSTERIKDGKMFVGYKFNPFTSSSQTNLHRPKVARKVSQPRIQSYHEAFNHEEEPCETIVDALNKGQKKPQKDKGFEANRLAQRRLSLKISQSVSALLPPPSRKPERECNLVNLEA